MLSLMESGYSIRDVKRGNDDNIMRIIFYKISWLENEIGDAKNEMDEQDERERDLNNLDTFIVL